MDQELSKHGKHDGGHDNRVDVFFHGDPGNTGGETLPADFADQVYTKLDWIISQNEQILAKIGGGADGGNMQETINNLTAQVKALTESQAQSQQDLQQRIEENK